MAVILLSYDRTVRVTVIPFELMASAGLLDRKKNSPVPLRSVRVEGTVRGYTAGTTSTLEYENEEEEPIEAIFTFPLDASSTVVDFSATVQSRKIVGRVEEKQKARETYDDAIASGQSAFLMESEREDVFTVAVGNLPPMEKASVTVGFVMELPTEPDGQVIRILQVSAFRLCSSLSFQVSALQSTVRVDTKV